MTTKTEYGNAEINAVMEHLKVVNNGMIDGSDKMNRRHCSTMLSRMGKWFPDKDRVRLLTHLIDIAKSDAKYGHLMTNMYHLVKNGASIIQSSQGRKNKVNGTSYVNASADALARKLADRQG